MTFRFHSFIMGFAVALAFFFGANLVAAHVQSDCGIAGVLRLSVCTDDIRRVGFPLLFWQEGGFAYVSRFDPGALMLDLGIGLVACTSVGLVVQRSQKQPERSH